jgi:hypothetical protein
MIERYGYYVLGFLTGLLHVSFFSEMHLFGMQIDMLIVATLSVILLKKRFEAYHFVLAAGITVDIFSPTPFGLNTLMLLGIVLLYEIILKSFFERRSLMAQVSLTFLANFLVFAYRYIILHVLFGVGVITFEPDIYTGTALELIGSGLINTVLLLILLAALNRVDLFIQNKIYQRSRYI